MRIITFTVNPALDCFMKVSGFAPDSVSIGSQEYFTAGGKGINGARLLRRFHFPCSALFTQGGCTGKELQTALRNEEVPFSCFRLSAQTRRNFVFEDADGRRFKVNGQGPQVSQEFELEHLISWVLVHCHEKDILLLGGSLLPGLPEDFYGQIASQASAKNVTVALDTGGSSFRAAIQNGIFYGKMNLTECSAFLGERLNSLEDALPYKQIFAPCKELLLTNARQGALLFAGGKIWKVSLLKIFSGLTVGCGDSFFASYMMRRLQGDDCAEALHYAAAVSADCAFSPVHHLAAPDRVQAYLNSIVVEQINEEA